MKNEIKNTCFMDIFGHNWIKNIKLRECECPQVFNNAKQAMQWRTTAHLLLLSLTHTPQQVSTCVTVFIHLHYIYRWFNSNDGLPLDLSFSDGQMREQKIWRHCNFVNQQYIVSCPGVKMYSIVKEQLLKILRQCCLFSICCSWLLRQKSSMHSF